jgi:V/A-type H+-transporting ATPase subunit I
MVGALFETAFLWLTLAGIAWILLGSLVRRPGGEPYGKALSESFETFFQLIINTVSFARVGAFALAHSGLSAAVVGISGGVESAAATVLILVIGNAFIIILEGLVVGIQTTRLVLFEFFVRFLTASGRQFLPLPAPDVALEPDKKETT